MANFARAHDLFLKLMAPIGILCTIITILMWDLRRVQILSDVIHDDHRSKYIEMNETVIGSWYTSSDICNMQQTRKRAALPKNCSETGKSSRDNLPSFCSIGFGSAANCNLSSVQFRLQLRDSKLANPNNMDLYDALTRIAIARKPLIFVGDVISRQNYHALLCSMLRTDKIRISSLKISNAAEVSSRLNHTLFWKNSQLSLQLKFFHMAHVFSKSSSSSSSLDPAYHRDPSFHAEYSDARMTVLSSSSNSLREFSRKALRRNGTSQITKYTSTSREEIKNSVSLLELWRNLNEIITVSKGFVLIANVGVWYNTRERFRTEIPSFLRMLSLFGKENDVFFRETSAQHWNHTKHGYFQNGGLPEEGSCATLVDASPSLDWRNRDVRFLLNKISQSGSDSNINVMEFRDLTAPLSELHPFEQFSADCTRFCYFPHMWLTIWRDLEIISRNSSRLHKFASKVDVELFTIRSQR